MVYRVRLLTLDGHASQEIYTTDGVPNSKKLVQVELSTGQRTRVHIERLLDADSLGKAIAIPNGHNLKGICPTCRAECDVRDGKIDCQTHGAVTVTVPIFLRQDKEIPEQMSQTQEQAGPVDLSSIAGYGTELWTKRSLHFDVATMDVSAHVLLASGPDRKLCFNTYNGTLGKRRGDPVDVLHLNEFSKATSIDGKPIGYLLPNGIDAERKRLAKNGYQIESKQAEAEEEQAEEVKSKD